MFDQTPHAAQPSEMMDDATLSAIRKLVKGEDTAEFPEHAETFFHMLENGERPALKLDPITRFRMAVAERLSHPDMPFRLMIVAAFILGVSLV